MFNIHTGFPHCDALSYLFLFSDPSIYSAITFPFGNLKFEILIILLPQFSLTYLQTQRKMLFLIHRFSFHANWYDLCDCLRDLLWEDFFKLGASAAAFNFCEWVKVGIEVYISHLNIRLGLIHLRDFQLLA